MLISPAQHQLHHSVAEEHYDKNYGAALAIWDWLFGSLHVSEGQVDMKFGLREDEEHSATNLRIMYLRPFVEIYLHCKAASAWAVQRFKIPAIRVATKRKVRPD